MLRKLKILLKVIKRITIHKFWVAYYCFQIGLYWQGIIHDLSKFSITELKGWVMYWNDSMSSLANEKRIFGYSRTFLHHRGRNPHHHEYWIHSLDEDGVAAPMPRKYALELVCDSLAACRTYGGNPKNEIQWWLEHKDNWKIHKDTKSFITSILKSYQYNNLKESVDLANLLGYEYT